jgi:hypothetical protein
VPERRVAEVVREADRLGERFIQPQRPCDRTCDLRDFDRVRQPRPVEIALVIDEHLRLVDEPPERGRMNDSIAVALVLAAQDRRRLNVHTSARGGLGGGVRGEGCGIGSHALQASISRNALAE